MQNQVVLVTVALLGIGCGSTGGPTTQATATPAFHTEASIQDIMDSAVDPSADFVWDSVSTSVGVGGIVDKAPKTKDEWKEVRRRIIVLLEASNMLKVPGRIVAPPGTKSENPGIEETPEEIQKLIDADRAQWIKATEVFHDAAVEMLKAADAKNSDAILDSGNILDEACESCHLKYWYPKQTEQLKQSAKEVAAEKNAGESSGEHKGSVRKQHSEKK